MCFFVYSRAVCNAMPLRDRDAWHILGMVCVTEVVFIYKLQVATTALTFSMGSYEGRERQASKMECACNHGNHINLYNRLSTVHLHVAVSDLIN